MPILSDSSKSIITENGSRPPYDKMMFSSSVENRKRHTFGSTQGGSSPLALVNNQRSNNIAFVDSNAPLTSDNSSSHGPDSNSQNNMSLLKEETKGNGIAATMVPSERTFLPSDLPKLTTNLVQEPNNNLQVPTKRPLHQRVASDDDALATLPSPATSVHDFPAALHVKHAPPVRKISSSSLNADNNHLLHNRSSSEGHLLKDNPAVEHYQRKGNLQTSDDTGPMIGHHTLQQVLSKLGLSKATEIIGHYVILKTIGMGAFSKVKLAIDLNTCKKVAIKMIATKGIRDSERLKASVSREVELLKYVGHPNIVGLLDTIDTPTHLCLVLEYVSGGELFDYVNDHYESSTEEESKFIFLQLVNTVEYLHENNIVHRDLKLENILIDSSISSSNGPIIKLTDFGLAKFIDKSSPLLTTRCGSEEYAAPELISGNPYDGRKTDIWSLGVILYALLVGYLPFNLEPNHTRKQFFSKIIRVDFTFPNRENESGRRSKISDEAKDLVKKILQNNPQKRLSLSEIKNHPWLNGVAI